jgi:transposase
MGRSRGGLTTKIHALVDACGLPVALKLTEGQAHDGVSAADMLGGLGAGQILLGERAYASDALRQALADRGAWANVKPMTNRKRTLAFSALLYCSTDCRSRCGAPMVNLAHSASFHSLEKIAPSKSGIKHLVHEHVAIGDLSC